MTFTGFAFYIAVRCGFDKHLYLTSHNTYLALPLTMIMEIMNCNRLLWGLPWQRQLVLVFGDLD